MAVLRSGLDAEYRKKCLDGKKMTKKEQAIVIATIKKSTAADYSVIDALVKEMLIFNADQRIPLTTALSRMETIYYFKAVHQKQMQLLSIIYANKMCAKVFASEAHGYDPKNEMFIAYLESIKVELEEKIPCMGLLIRCLKPLKTEREDKMEDTSLINLQQSIREAICFYIKETYTMSNVKNKDRIASVRRIRDINCLLDYLEDATSHAALIKKVLDWEQSLERGFLNRSVLGSLVHKAILKNSSKLDHSSFFKVSNSARVNESMSAFSVRFRP